MPFHHLVFAEPVLERTAEIPAGAVIEHGGRPLIVRRVGSDPAAPVILEELATFGTTLAGQLALWSADGVLRAMKR